MRKLAAFACAAIAAGALFADGSTPVMVSLVTPVQAPGRSRDVKGLRLSLVYGECRGFTGLDIGVVGNAREDFTGLAVGGFNFACGRMYGGQVGLLNWNGNSDAAPGKRSAGAQLGVVNVSHAFCGLQDGLVNISGSSFSGLQSGFFNCAEDMCGMQSGYYFLIGVNVATGTMRGVQMGLVNYADTVDGGCQIGIVNVISHNGWLPVLPILNGSF